MGSTFDLTITGQNFHPTGATDEVYQSNGNLMGSGQIISRSVTRLITRESMAGAAPGNYTIRVRNPDGLRSNSATLTLTVGISVSPMSGAAGTQFTYSGRGFTGSLGVTSHLRRPDGTEFPTLQIATSADGDFTHVINSANFTRGTYQVWAVDNNMRLSSAPVSFVVQ